MTTTLHHTRGRGSNPASRQNLGKAVRRWFIFSRATGAGWIREPGGPYHYKEATKRMARLVALNQGPDPRIYYVSTSAT